MKTEKSKRTRKTILWLVLAAICVIYGLVVRAVGSGTGFYIAWLLLGLVFILFAVAAKRGLWKKVPKIWRRIFTGLVVVGICVFAFVEACIISGFRQHGAEDLDYIIVLGAQVYESGPSVVLKYRLDEAIGYLNENPDTLCIVSGGQGYNEPYAEAVGMAAYLEEHGIPEERIILEDTSKNTEQNMINSMALMPEQASVGLVTNDFHVFRAVWIAKKQGMTNVCGIAADSTTLFLPNNMFREFFGVVKYVIF